MIHMPHVDEIPDVGQSALFTGLIEKEAVPGSRQWPPCPCGEPFLEPRRTTGGLESGVYECAEQFSGELILAQKGNIADHVQGQLLYLSILTDGFQSNRPSGATGKAPFLNGGT